MPRFSTLDRWLEWQSGLHPESIELGLERVEAVASRLGLIDTQAIVITVAGTNGKGSSVAMLDAIYRAAGYRTCTYTSPHLLRYNERIRINGDCVDDQALCRSFEQVDQARKNTSLTYFEFGTLAALEIFSRAQPDVIILEVGLGGRLDAVNIVSADVALVTSIAIDHSNWLGNDRDKIGYEKAGIFRPGRPAVCSDPQPPDSLRKQAELIGANWMALGTHYSYEKSAQGWGWQGDDQCYEVLPLPALAGRHQLDNAAGVIRVLTALAEVRPVKPQAIAEGLLAVTLAGRCQLIPGPVEQVFDVAHNPASAVQLAEFLAERPVAGHTWLVLGMLTDKDHAGFAAELKKDIDHWCLAGLDDERGLSAQQLAPLLELPGSRKQCFRDVSSAYRHAQAAAKPGDRIVVSGSFLAVAAALASQV